MDRTTSLSGGGRRLRMTEVESEKQETAANLEDEQALSAIEQLLGLGNTQGYVTYDDVMKAVPEAELNIEQLEDALAALIERGIEISDADLVEPVDDEEPKKRKHQWKSRLQISI
ncbi:unnamed protein product [marine sediment metagenome]|uniref:RNA polymerase sigma factor 70 region 1.1 domain-containing protein n=1 Tax=marine sediment metagenome TaxID=412755 RepID=X0WFG9_9ZZZZ